jgi:hydroxymethylbilane synthase
VHSAKDVPLVMREGLAIAAFPGPREDPQDALVTATGTHRVDTLPAGAVFGTDSPRRAGFLLAHRPDLRHRPIHGNVDTRLRRLAEGEVDALVLAVAGLVRMGARHRIDEYIHPEVLPPAPGQGALAIQCRADDTRVLEALAELDDPAVRLAVQTERTVLEATGGSCRAPVGALAAITGGRLCLLAGAAAPDGSARCAFFLDCEPDEAAGMEMARRAGQELMNKVVSRVA